MKVKISILFFAAAFFLGGCGYRIGFTGHPQINSVAVAPVTNETLLFNAAGTLRSLLCERIMNDGTYKLRREADADCIIHARVVKADFSEISWSSDEDITGEYFPEYYKVKVEIEYSLILPGRVKPLVGSTHEKDQSFGYSHIGMHPDCWRDGAVSAFTASGSAVSEKLSGLRDSN